VDWINPALEWAWRWTLLDTAVNRLHRRKLISLSFIDVRSLHLICLLCHVQLYMYLSTISNSGLRYDQPKDSGGRVCLKSTHLSQYVNLAADPHLATGVVQDSAQKRVFTADQRSARNLHLYIRHYPKT
jgi:hypothetical protein